jgi:hypothetical protein
MPGFEPITFLMYDSTPREPVSTQGIGYITSFDGSGWVQLVNISGATLVMQGTLAAGANAALLWDTDSSNDFAHTSMIYPDPATWPGIAPMYGFVPQYDAGFQSIPNAGVNYTFNFADPKMTNETLVKFLIRFTDAAPDMFYARLARPNDQDWYRSVKPWAFGIHVPGGQQGNVDIYKNVINPNNGDLSKLHYVLPRDGNVTIQVFSLSGDLVKVLYRGRLGAGEHSTVWDGRNSGGRVVARGLYFIKIVAPDIDETRKVLVVK